MVIAIFESTYTSLEEFWFYRLKYSFQIIVFLSTYHYVVGYLVSVYLISLIGTEAGAFQFHFESIALRIEFSEAELVIKNFVWNNPSRFTSTPFFLKVRSIWCIISICITLRVVMMLFSPRFLVHRLIVI
jgi:hypothetical protein